MTLYVEKDLLQMTAFREVSSLD